MNSTPEQIIELLLTPLQEVFGNFNKGTIKWLIENCQKYTPDELQKCCNDTIGNCKSFPYPAVIMDYFPKPKSKYDVWKN